MPIRLTELIERVDPHTEKVVADTRQRFNQAVRGHLRDETRLTLSTAADGEEQREVRSVRVSVTAGYPEELEGQVFDDELALSLAIAPLTSALEDAHQSLAGLRPAIGRLDARADFTTRFPGATETLDEAQRLLAALIAEASRAKALDKIFAIRDDVLGVYRYTPPAQPSWDDTDEANSRIELYWGVIGLAARLLGVSVEALTVKVLAHELAHAYTHVGADADGRRWGSTAFSRTDRSLKEGLAQYYTWRVLERLGRQAMGSAVARSALEAAEKLLPFQPKDYHTHRPWLEEFTPEEVREAMLTLRCHGAGKLADFEELLKQARQRRRSK